MKSRVLVLTLMTIALSIVPAVGAQDFTLLRQPYSAEAMLHDVTRAIGVPSPGRGRVVFFRRHRFNAGNLGFHISEDDVEIVNLKMLSWFYVEAWPGRHVYVARARSAPTISIMVKPGETYFIEGKIDPGLLFPKRELILAISRSFLDELKWLRSAKPAKKKK